MMRCGCFGIIGVGSCKKGRRIGSSAIPAGICRFRSSSFWQSLISLSLNALLSGIHRTVANVINRVQAREWMPPLSKEDRDVHQKACDKLHKEQEDESITPDHCLQYWENDPLPLESWEPTVFKEEQDITMYREHITYMKDYLEPICQWFYQHYGRDLNAEQDASLCLFW